MNTTIQTDGRALSPDGQDQPVVHEAALRRPGPFHGAVLPGLHRRSDVQRATTPVRRLAGLVRLRDRLRPALVLFWDTLRQRGNNFLEHERAGKPPLLVYDYEIVVDGRKLERPVNYALVRIIPPDGVRIDETNASFLIVDPRAGHGPGIGGFKQDSQVGVALKAGHPVYFVIFFPGRSRARRCRDVVRGRGRSSSRWSRSGTRTAPSRPSSATARAAGRPCCWPRRARSSPARWSSTAPRCRTGAAAGAAARARTRCATSAACWAAPGWPC